MSEMNYYLFFLFGFVFGPNCVSGLASFQARGNRVSLVVVLFSRSDADVPQSFVCVFIFFFLFICFYFLVNVYVTL